MVQLELLAEDAPGSPGRVGSPARGPQRGARTQYWCFTFTNLEGPPEEDLPEDPDLYRNFRLQPGTLNELELWKYQPEVGAGQEDQMDGLLHIQGFCKTKRKGLRYAQLNRIFGMQSYQVHWEPARNFAAAWDYCGKPDTRLEGGMVHDTLTSYFDDEAPFPPQITYVQDVTATFARMLNII